jgi:X-X-X-Leu-X-X-Gly heptad repeat protein
MLSQFSSSSDSNNPTIFDGVNGVSNGSQSLSTNASSYIGAVDNTLFTMIKNDPSSTSLLVVYKTNLSITMTAYSKSTDGAAKQKYLQQIQMLSNLVNLYTVGTDPTVTTVSQFEAKLYALAQKSDSNTTVVSSGAKVKAGASQLSDASQKVVSQFSDGATFKAGMVQLADGTTKLAQSSGNLNALQDGINKLSDSLSQLKDGSSKLYEGAESLQSGIETAQNGGMSLKTGSDELVDASSKIKDGSAELAMGVALAGQKDEIVAIMDKLSSNKDEKIADAFDKTFLIAAIILMLASVLGLFTDKNSKSPDDSDEKKKSVHIAAL